jgi:thiamine biosynthesis lipoprotein
VSAASCTDANIASTAAIIRGHAAPAWLTGLGLPARLVDEAGRVRTVGGWPTEDGRPEKGSRPEEAGDIP